MFTSDFFIRYGKNFFDIFSVQTVFYPPPGYSSQKSPRKNSSLQNFKFAETGERFIQFLGFPWLRRRFVRVLSAALLCGPWRRFMLLACICSACRRFVALWGLWCVVSWRAVYSSMNTAPGLLLRISFLYSSKNAAGASSSACFALALFILKRSTPADLYLDIIKRFVFFMVSGSFLAALRRVWVGAAVVRGFMLLCK